MGRGMFAVETDVLRCGEIFFEKNWKCPSIAENIKIKGRRGERESAQCANTVVLSAMVIVREGDISENR